MIDSESAREAKLSQVREIYTPLRGLVDFLQDPSQTDEAFDDEVGARHDEEWSHDISCKQGQI